MSHYERAAAYLAEADELAENMETSGYGVVLTYAMLVLAHLQLAAHFDGEVRR